MIRHYCELRVANHVGRLHQVDAPFSFSKYSSAMHNRKPIKTYRIGSLGNIKATMHRPQLQNILRGWSFGPFSGLPGVFQNQDHGTNKVSVPKKRSSVFSSLKTLKLDFSKS